MFTDIITFLDSIKDVFMENVGLASTSVIAFGTTAWGFITKAKLGFSKKETVTAVTENVQLKQRINTLESKVVDLTDTVKDGFANQAKDTAIIGESFNLLGQNSRAAGLETKAKLKSQITNLSGLTDAKIESINLESQEILKQISIPNEVNSLKNKISTAGQSILDKYLSEDAVDKVKEAIVDNVDDIKEIL